LVIDELIAIKELLLTNMFHFKISNHINHKIINLNNLIEQEIIISDKQVVLFCIYLSQTHNLTLIYFRLRC